MTAFNRSNLTARRFGSVPQLQQLGQHFFAMVALQLDVFVLKRPARCAEGFHSLEHRTEIVGFRVKPGDDRDPFPAAAPFATDAHALIGRQAERTVGCAWAPTRVDRLRAPLARHGSLK